MKAVRGLFSWTTDKEMMGTKEKAVGLIPRQNAARQGAQPENKVYYMIYAIEMLFLLSGRDAWVAFHFVA